MTNVLDQISNTILEGPIDFCDKYLCKKCVEGKAMNDIVGVCGPAMYWWCELCGGPGSVMCDVWKCVINKDRWDRIIL